MKRDLPTISNQKKAHPWFFGAYEDARRQSRYQGASRQGSCQTRGLASLPNLLPRVDYCVRTVLTMLCMLKISRINISKYFLFVIA